MTSEAIFVPPDMSTWPAHWQRPTPEDLEVMEAGYRRGLRPPHARTLRRRVAGLMSPGSEACEAVVARLYQVAREEVDAKQRRIGGVAAPQVGRAARVILFDPRDQTTDEGASAEQLECVVNPEIELLGGGTLWPEGCLSTGRIGGWVVRAERVRLTGFAPSGDPVDKVVDGRAAMIVQHEVDHLHGVLFPDRVDGELLWIPADRTLEFREHVKAVRHGEIPSPWPIVTPRDQWEAITYGEPVFGDLRPDLDAPGVVVQE